MTSHFMVLLERNIKEFVAYITPSNGVVDTIFKNFKKNFIKLSKKGVKN